MQKKDNLKKNAVRFKRFSRKGYSVFNSLHKVINTGVVAAAVLAFANTENSAAQNSVKATQEQKIAERELGEVTVTASRVELPVDLVAKVVTVITRDEIQRSPFQTVQDLLNYVAGVDIQQRGTHGVQADISIRGGSYEQTAILLNGINISNPQTGHFSLTLPVNLSDIERIEIIHGPSSIIYGASAFSGGINIITRKTPEQNGYAKIEGGQYGFFGAEGNGVLKSKIATNQFSAGYKRADGDQTNSDYRIGNLFWQSHFKIDNSKIDFQLGYNDKAFGANTFYSARFPNQYEKTRNYLASLKGETGTTLKFIPSIYWNRTNDQFQLIKNDASKVPFNYHQTDVYGANLNLQYTSRLGISSFGAELRNESVLSTVLGVALAEAEGKYTKSFNRTNISYALEHNVIYQGLTITAGVLANTNTSLHQGYKLYPSISAGYRVSPQWKFFSSWSKATRMPSFTELFYTTNTTHIGNPNLKPEYSESFEVGVNYGNRFLKAYLTGFLMQGKNLIDWVKYGDSETVWYSINHTTINKKGLEVGVKLSMKELIEALPKGTSLQLDYARLNQSKDAGTLVSNYVLNNLRDKFTARLELPILKNLSTTWNFRWQKREGTYEKYENLVKVGDEPYPTFSTLDLQVNYKPKSKLTLFANVNNLYNTHYFDIGNVPQAGFWAMGGISCSF